MRTKILLAVFALVAVVSEGQVQAGFTKVFEFRGGRYGVSEPHGGLAWNGSSFYGVSEYGGANTAGVLYKINLEGSGLETLRDFGGVGDGVLPLGGVTIVGTDLYGTTSFGAAGPGAVYRMKLDGSDYSVIHQFTDNHDLGAVPGAGLLAIGSRLYGTTILGGENKRGTLFSMNMDGSDFDVLHHFAGGSEDGWRPRGELITDGTRIYGMTQIGGADNSGTVYGINLDGTGLQVLHSLAGVESEYQGSLSLLQIGSMLYGTTPPSPDNFGSVFRINSDGTGFETLHEFPQNSDDYQRPTSGLVLIGSTLYGTTAAAQRNSLIAGAIYKIGLDGSGFEVVHKFSNLGVPSGGLTVVGSKFYGTTLGFNNPILYSYAVPEPSTALLLALGLFVIACVGSGRRFGASRSIAVIRQRPRDACPKSATHLGKFGRLA